MGNILKISDIIILASLDAILMFFFIYLNLIFVIQN